MLGIFIMMNNYFHDVATGLLAASGMALWFIMHRLDANANAETVRYFLRIYENMSKVAKFSLYWILIGGIPRTIFYKDFEWSTAVAHAQVPAIIVKHVIVFAIVGFGAHIWIRFNKQVKDIKARLKQLEQGTAPVSQ